jgi:hypothetical protein
MQRSIRKVLRLVPTLLIFCAFVAVQLADAAPNHHASHANAPYCGLCLAAHAPAISGGSALHRELTSPPEQNGTSRAADVLAPEEASHSTHTSRGPPR